MLFGWADLLVSFGGIAGLFLGFSLLSGAEIVYYFTMRAGCMFAKNRVNCQSPQWQMLNIHFSPFFCLFFAVHHPQQQLYALQKEKESRPQTQYDLSLAPKLKGCFAGEKRQSLSMSRILVVKPVEHSKDVNNIRKIFDYGLETSISDTSEFPRAEKEINRKYHDVRFANEKKVTCAERTQFT